MYIINMEFYESQIKILEEHGLIYQAVKFKFEWNQEKNKINKTLEIMPGKYKNVTVETRTFNKAIHNGVAVMLGKNYYLWMWIMCRIHQKDLTKLKRNII